MSGTKEKTPSMINPELFTRLFNHSKAVLCLLEASSLENRTFVLPWLVIDSIWLPMVYYYPACGPLYGS